MPLYREEDIHSRAGHIIRRSTICNCLSQLGLLAEPIGHADEALILDSKVIHTDDTKIKMLQPGICTGSQVLAIPWRMVTQLRSR